MRPGFASCYRMGGDLFFKPSGLFFPRLTNQHPLSFGPRIGSRRLLKLIEISPKWLSAVH